RKTNPADCGCRLRSVEDGGFSGAIVGAKSSARSRRPTLPLIASANTTCRNLPVRWATTTQPPRTGSAVVYEASKRFRSTICRQLKHRESKIIHQNTSLVDGE